MDLDSNNLQIMNGDTNTFQDSMVLKVQSWTILNFIPGKDDLYIINRLNGKKFKVKMEEIPNAFTYNRRNNCKS